MLEYLITGTDMLNARPGFKLAGRANALHRLSSILIKSKSNSVIISGPGGVGISSLVLGLQALKTTDNVQFDILCKRMFWLDTDALFMSNDSKQININFDKMMYLLNRTPESILVIEDTFDFIEAARGIGSNYFINSFMSAIKQKTNQFIFQTRNSTLDAVYKCHSDMLECTTLFDLEEPSNGELLEIIQENAKHLTKHHCIKITDDAVVEAVNLTTTHRTRNAALSRAQPERTVNLLDSALASLRLDAHKVDPETQTKLKEFHSLQRESEKNLQDLEEELSAVIGDETKELKEQSTGEAFDHLVGGTFKSEKRKLIEKTIKAETAQYELHKKNFADLTAKVNENLFLDLARVQQEFSKITGIPVDKLNEDSRAQLRNLNTDIKKLIFDQDESVDKVCNFIKVAKLDKKNKIPVRVLLLGPSGVGKSETPRSLAQQLQLPLVTFNMADYSEKHSKAKMINCPPGYEGFVAGGGILIEAGRNNPTGIFLFDEIEKADPSVFDIFLSVLDNGFLNDNLGREVSFANCIFVFTSNVGAAWFLSLDNVEEARVKATEDLVKSIDQGGGGLRNEFLNRFYGREGIMGYNRLGLPAMEKITKREFDKLDVTYSENNVHIILKEDTIQSFVKDRYNPIIGARGLPGIISSQIKPVIVDQLLKEGFNGGTLSVGYDSDTKKFVPQFADMALVKAA